MQADESPATGPGEPAVRGEHAMTWLDQRIQLHNADDQTSDWIAKARTPETRARIRRWSRLETFGVMTASVGLVVLFAAPIATVALLIWFYVAGIDRIDVYWLLWSVAIGVPLVGGILMTVGGSRRLAACFADGYVSTGRVDQVIEQRAVSDEAWYELRVSAVMPDGGVLHRKVYRDGNHPGRRLGRPACPSGSDVESESWLRRLDLDLERGISALRMRP